jgi:outer membrane protein insertion porin family
MKKITLLFVLFLNLMLAPAWAATTFTIKRIEIDGLQRISQETVFSYLPVKVGQTLRSDKTGQIISALYKTGFFEHISLSRQGDTLVIKVLERSTIGQLKITGNNLIATDKLTSVMKGLDIAEGRAYNQAVLDRIKQSLLNQYYELGRYNARIDVTVTPMERNRVLVKIDISEGLVAKIRNINIIGSHAFSANKLIDQMTLTTSGLLTFLTQTDQYSQEKLESSLDNIRNYYLDRGYVKFSVKSVQVSITPDRKSVFITIAVEEGQPYKVKGYTLSGDLILPRAELMKRIKIKVGDTFSRQAIMNTEKNISDALGEKGYIYANIALLPNIDDVKKEIFLNFEVKPGKRTYVRHIFFSDNTKTNDLALRREVQQMESSVVSTSKLEESKHRLNLLPYVRGVDMALAPVAGSENLVDVNYKVTEQNTAEITGRVGYSQLERFIVGAGINNKNFLGTGKTLGLNFQRSRFLQEYAINYTDPYYTQDGISRSVNLSISKYNAGNANVSNYSTNEYDLGVMYSIPLRQFDQAINRLQLGYGYQNTLVAMQSSSLGSPSIESMDFINKHGRHFQQLDLSLGMSRDSRDRAVFPTQGMLQSIGLDIFLPLAKQSLHYYTVNYNNNWYQPIAKDFILATRAAFGYGNSLHGGAANYPFFKNFYAGGVGSVRGYEGNSLGPRDSNNKPSGGNFLADASIGLIFPNFISENLRTTWFVDAGNVYKTFDNRPLGGSASGTLRYSMGIDAQWFVPFLGAPIEVSLAKALRPHRTASNRDLRDNLEGFQFSLGANLG